MASAMKGRQKYLKCPGLAANVFLKETQIRAISMVFWHSRFWIFAELCFRTNWKLCKIWRMFLLSVFWTWLCTLKICSARKILNDLKLSKTTQSNKSKNFPATNYLLKVTSRNTRARCEICLKLTKKTPRRSCVFIVKFEHISHLVLEFLLLNLSRLLPPGLIDSSQPTQWRRKDVKSLNFGLKDAVDWSEMEVATTFS